MPSTGYLAIVSMLVMKICICRYVVPERPPVELKNLTNHHPEQEFRDQALRVGNIIADLLRSEIRLMLKINSTIADGKKHHGLSDGKRSKSHHHHQETEEHISSEESHSKEIHKSEEIHVEVHHIPDHHPAENHHHLPDKGPKVTGSHDEIYKNVEKEGAFGKTKDCVCPSISASKIQPNTVMLEQNIYGASLSGESPDSSSPIIVQKFIWNPHVSQIPASSQQARGQTYPQVLAHPVVSKPSPTSTAHIGKQPSVNLNNQGHNMNSQSPQIVPEPKTSVMSTSEPHIHTSYNPLASLAETNEKYTESINRLDLQEHSTQHEAGDFLLDGGIFFPEAESQAEIPGFELVETTMTEKAPEVVKEEVIEVHNSDED